MRRVGLTLGILCAAAMSNAARADDFFSDLKSDKGYTVTLGADARMMPKFEGSDRFELIPLPLFDIRPMGTPARFVAPRDGLGVTVYEIGKFSFGPVAHLEFARKVKSDPALTGLGDVKWAVEFGGFAEYWPVDWLRARTELRKGFKGHHGVILDEAVDAIFPFDEVWTVSGGPRMTIANTSGNGRYFDISPEQSVASGLPVYDTKAGIRSVGAGSKVRYEWTPQWATHAYVEYDRLVSGAGSSPLVTERGTPNQTTLGAGVTYSFDIAK